MNKIDSKFLKVPAVGKQELLSYIAEHFPLTSLKITTDSGISHKGIILNIGNEKREVDFVILQVADERNSLANNFIHLSVHKIESIEIINPTDPVNILSLGKIIKSETYENSGKLEVRRGFQTFAETVLSASNVNTGTPTMELPEDGLKLNRIFRLTQKIQLAVIDLLKDEDAQSSWKTHYDKITFINSDSLDVKGINGLVKIHFPFEDIDSPEISSKEFTDLLMAIL